MADEVGHENMISYLTNIQEKVQNSPIFNQFLNAGHEDLGILPDFVVGDPDRMKQVMINLVQNAI